MYNYILERAYELIKSRIFVLTCLFIFLFLILVAQCFNLQIINGEGYQEQYTLLIQKTRDVTGTRGNIYDRNGKLLAYNELAYQVTIEDNGDYSSISEKNEVINKTIRDAIEVIEDNNDSVISSFKIVLDKEGNYQFTNPEGITRQRFIADIYGQAYIDNLTKEQSNSSAKDIIEYLCTDSKYGYGIELSDVYEDRVEILKMVNIRYAMSLNTYRKYIATTIAEDVSEVTVATILENSNELQGVTISEYSLRRYVDSEYFASILGYTGAISQEEYDENIEKGLTNYTINDVVGKSGIEKEMDEYLQGERGEEKIYVNSVGKVIDTISTTQAVAGDNLYLTIDSDLQIFAYDLLEETLAGIVLNKLVNQLSVPKEASSNILIPIGDVYGAFFTNGILDTNQFNSEDASQIERNVMERFSQVRADSLDEIIAYLKNPKGEVREDLSSTFSSFITQVTATILLNESGIIIPTKLDTNDNMYSRWVIDKNVNAYTYLNYVISQNWIDTSLLMKEGDEDVIYSDSNEIFASIIEYVEEALNNNTDFDKLVYKSMILNKQITGREICLLALEQDVFEYTTSEYNAIDNGTMAAYTYLYNKIKNIELTPGQLALEPCSGSIVLTDPENGDVLALVSYPGYDNNRLANTIDTQYYAKLVSDLASPFYNHATQEKTAPGSTYKMVTLAAGITENVITYESILYCDGLYEKVLPNPKCWIHPNGHGGQNPTTALQNSCNNYFYEIGYRLSLRDRSLIGTDDKLGSTTEKYYSSNLGLESLTYYSSLFGLDQKTGIEIPESQPQISDTASVPSAIGQGTHNYTTSQLARYVATIANQGMVYDLTLLDNVSDVKGNLIKEFTADSRDKITEITPATWSTIHSGMELMVENSSAIDNLEKGVTLAGKTGTAQQSLVNPNHALFVGFTPVNNPTLSMAIRITNGYNSGYAARLGADITNYYSKALERDEIITGQASDLGVTIDGD